MQQFKYIIHSKFINIYSTWLWEFKLFGRWWITMLSMFNVRRLNLHIKFVKLNVKFGRMSNFRLNSDYSPLFGSPLCFIRGKEMVKISRTILNGRCPLVNIFLFLNFCKIRLMTNCYLLQLIEFLKCMCLLNFYKREIALEEANVH